MPDIYHPVKWRGWLDFGSGALGDIACHVWGAVNMALRLGGSIRPMQKTFSSMTLTRAQTSALCQAMTARK